MSASFVAIAFLAAVLLLNWRLVLLVITACLIALMIFGLGIVRPEAASGATPDAGTAAPAPVHPGGEIGQPGHG